MSVKDKNIVKPVWCPVRDVRMGEDNEKENEDVEE
jgi:hypothetical protein